MVESECRHSNRIIMYAVMGLASETVIAGNKTANAVSQPASKWAKCWAKPLIHANVFLSLAILSSLDGFLTIFRYCQLSSLLLG